MWTLPLGGAVQRNVHCVVFGLLLPKITLQSPSSAVVPVVGAGVGSAQLGALWPSSAAREPTLLPPSSSNDAAKPSTFLPFGVPHDEAASNAPESFAVIVYCVPATYVLFTSIGENVKSTARFSVL